MNIRSQKQSKPQRCDSSISGVVRRCSGLASSQTGFSTLGLVVGFFILITLITGSLFLVNRSSTDSKIHNLQSRVDDLEQKAKNGSLKAEDIINLDSLKSNVADLKTRTNDLSADTSTQLADLARRLTILESTAAMTSGPQGTTGPSGTQGSKGDSGAPGPPGAQGPSGIVSCPNGNCLSLQATSQGIQETGSVNISGTVLADSFSGNGTNVTNVDASYLSGFNAGHFTNASNISSGTLADGRLTTNVTLQGNVFNGASQLVLLNGSAQLPAVSGTLLTSLNGTNIDSGTVVNARLVNSGTLTVTTGIGLAGGGSVALGDSITLTNSGVLSVSGTSNQITVSSSTGSISLSLPQDIAVTSSPMFANLTITNALTTGTLTFGTSISSNCSGLSGYIWVPGNAKFGTMPGFCVMKYNASDDGSGNAVSVPGVTPWVNISQRTAEDKASAVCAGCHLLSDNEWVTIATNALWQSSNWCQSDGSGCGNAPGTASRFLAAGHNDNAPAQALAGSVTDSEACYSTVTAGVNTVCGSAGTQKRTLTLSNGNVIWDIGGNVYDWTDNWVIGNEEPNDAVNGFAWHEFTAITQWKGLNNGNPTNRGWNSSQALGLIYTDGTSTNNTLYAFRRGGGWSTGALAGAFTLGLDATPTDTDADIGFRVAR